MTQPHACARCKMNVPADKEGKIVFQCWMAMVKGEIDVKS